MTGNPKTSPWYATPRDKRRRKKVELTLSDEAVKALGEMADARQRSAFVDELIKDARSRMTPAYARLWLEERKRKAV